MGLVRGSVEPSLVGMTRLSSSRPPSGETWAETGVDACINGAPEGN